MHDSNESRDESVSGADNARSEKNDDGRTEKDLIFYEYQVGALNRSEVWKHFHVNEEKTKARCIHCHKLYAFIGTTTTLMKHLRKFHPKKLTEKKLVSPQIAQFRSKNTNHRFC